MCPGDKCIHPCDACQLRGVCYLTCRLVIAQEDDEKLENKVKMARVREWANSLDPVPWEDINDAARRLGVRGSGPKPQFHSTNVQSNAEDSRAREKRRGSRRSELLSSDSPMSPDNDTSTHISDSEIRHAAGELLAPPHRPPLSTGFSQGRPALRYAIWAQNCNDARWPPHHCILEAHWNRWDIVCRPKEAILFLERGLRYI